ncbi:hypothetical protein, partial [Acetonema longum]
TIKANQNLTIDTGSITNQTGLITGGEVTLTADDTLANISGLISGDNVTLTAGAILNQTAAEKDTYRELEQTHLLDTAGIIATGTLSLTATTGSILNQGALLGAGKDL